MKKNTQSYDNLSFQILVSSTNNAIPEIDHDDYLVINQILDDRLQEINREHVFNYYEKGISKSRNRALEQATGDICLISDDDIQFKPDIKNKILDAFKQHPRADVITFQIETPDGDYYKDYPTEKFWHDPKTLMDVSSVEIAFRRKSVMANQLKFDELFGLGAKFPTGEEFIFLTDALKKGLHILYVPEVIVVHPKESWGDKWYIPKYIKSKGALLYRVFGWKAYFWALILSFKKYSDSDYSFSHYLRHMIDGMKEYRRQR